MTKILFISGHDYRSPRKANIHFIAQASRAFFDEVAFVSIGFSNISLMKSDTRSSLAAQANRWEERDGIRCYLWKTPFHPFNVKNQLAKSVAGFAYDAYATLPSTDLDDAFASADVIVFESGLSPIFIERARRRNAKARFLYVASDLLTTIGVHARVLQAMDRGMDQFSVIRIAARDMSPAFDKAADRVRFIPHGIDKSIADWEMTDPYAGGVNIVTVGSMLFDASFFEIAATAFPEMKFHVIGAKGNFTLPDNVQQYPETPFAKTLPYIKFADAGVAPYRPHGEAGYLADSSMKLTQYGFLGLPAICPEFAVGDYPGRYGYTPGDEASIIAAVKSAVAAKGKFQPKGVLSWQEVTQQLLAA